MPSESSIPVSSYLINVTDFKKCFIWIRVHIRPIHCWLSEVFYSRFISLPFSLQIMLLGVLFSLWSLCILGKWQKRRLSKFKPLKWGDFLGLSLNVVIGQLVHMVLRRGVCIEDRNRQRQSQEASSGDCNKSPEFIPHSPSIPQSKGEGTGPAW